MGRTRGFVEISARAHELGIPHSRIFRVWGWDRESETERPGLYLRDVSGDVHRLGTDEAEALETLAELVGKVPQEVRKEKAEATLTDALRGEKWRGRRRNPQGGE